MIYKTRKQQPTTGFKKPIPTFIEKNYVVNTILPFLESVMLSVSNIANYSDYTVRVCRFKEDHMLCFVPHFREAWIEEEEGKLESNIF